MRIIVLFSFLSFVLIPNSHSSSEDPSYIKITAHNIGQGNCITAELFDVDQKKPIYLLMDAGSSAFRKEFACQAYFLEKRQRIELEKALEEGEAEEYELSSPPRPSTSSAIPQSILRAPTPRESRVLTAKVGGSYKDIKDEIVEGIRKALGRKKKKKSPIKVTTFFVSHPDSDHYNFFEDIFNHRKDIIQNIILGGLPAKYSSEFSAWLQRQISLNETKVYFPALALDQPLSSIKTVLRQCKDIEGLMYSPLYAPQMFSTPEKGWIPVEHLKDFEKALPFSKNIQTYLLSVNPTHWKEEGEEVARGSFSDDDNSDSLVIKLQVGEHSIIITGDATELITGRILRNYKNRLDFLKSTILTSDHHGSKTHGSNNLPWIRATAPQHVIFSCGIMHGHPSLDAYNNAKQSSNLARTESHDIWIWETPEKKKDKEGEETYTKGRKVRVHTTYQSLFSTFSSGTLTFTLPEAGEISIESQILDFGLKKLGLKKHYKTSPAKEEFESRSEEKALDIPFEEEELEELEKSFLEETEAALTPEKLMEPQKLIFHSPSPYESGTKKRKKQKHGKAEEKEESSVTPLLEVEKKVPLQKKGLLATQSPPLKSTSGVIKKPKKVLYKSLSDEKKPISPNKQELKALNLEEEEFADLEQSSRSVSSRKTSKSEKLSPFTSESSSKSKKKQRPKRKQREIAPEEEKAVVKEKGPKKQRGDSFAIKDKPAKGGSSIAKKKEHPKKKQKQPTEKSEKKKGPQATTSKGKKGGGKKNK